MTGLPTVQVLLDDGTGTFPFDITSKVLIADGWRFSRGRQDWQGGVTSGDLSLTLNNADGRFTPGSTILATPSPIKVDQRIRIKETVNATTFTRFTGYVKSWPVAWPATVSSWSTVRLVATDAQARAERQVLKSVVDEEFGIDTPIAYYPVDDAAGTVLATDRSGNQHDPLALSGSGVLGDTSRGLTSAMLHSTGVLQASYGAAGVPAVGVCFAFSASPVTATVTIGAFGSSATDFIGTGFGIFQISSSGNLYNLVFYIAGNGANGIASSTTVADGNLHVAEVQYSGGTWTLYLDGSAVGSLAGSAPSPVALLRFVGDTFNTNATVAQVALFSTATGSARAASRAKAILTGFAGESGVARITRLAGYANLPVGTLDASLTNVAAAETAGRSPWDALQQAANAEVGVVYFDGSGNLTFHNRNRPAAKTAPDLTLSAAYITPDVQPVTDDQQMVNYVEGTAAGTGTTQVVRNTASEASHGRYPTSVEYLVQTDQEVTDRINWIVGNFAEPTTRYGTLTINLYAMTAPQAAAVLSAIEIDCWLQVTSMPSQNTGGTTADVVVEGYAEEVTASSWKLTCNVVSKSLTDCLILGDPVRGLLDAGNRLYI
ncbi:hypothetical protein [Nocardioides pocheonensis]|uniref:LamG domain-containing protein n=1 Tax=Nocardioides pocheonensis TaxID=661485 RepID=A0A3N0GLL6_9ACTN|nr:hypothetical protein [Nocardioides pocheonensis]RNM13289.1 hypothetical protein EFL26_15870 [Nocardioides pocheonensis]